MIYSLCLFSCRIAELKTRLETKPEKVLEQTRSWLKKNVDEPDVIAELLIAANKYLEGKLPRNASQDYFDACYAIFASQTELIKPGRLQSFSSILQLDESGIHDMMRVDRSPIKFPKTKEELPEFGFIANESLREAIPVVLGGLVRSKNDSVNQARREFIEVSESVAADGLDVILYLSVW
jgi:hypothetical protein